MVKTCTGPVVLLDAMISLDNDSDVSFSLCVMIGPMFDGVYYCSFCTLSIVVCSDLKKNKSAIPVCVFFYRSTMTMRLAIIYKYLLLYPQCEYNLNSTAQKGRKVHILVSCTASLGSTSCTNVSMFFVLHFVHRTLCHYSVIYGPSLKTIKQYS